jgi:HEAT repeat protein
MAGYGLRSKKFLVALFLAILLGGAGVAWMERATLLAWFYVRGLAQAGEGQRQRWVDRVAGLGEAALPGLTDCLADSDGAVCRNAGAALADLSGRWGCADTRTVALALHLGRDFAGFSPPGQRQALDVAVHWFNPRPDTPAPGLVPACARLLEEAARVPDPEVQAGALDLCTVLLQQAQAAEALSAGRAAVRAGLQSPAAANRLHAVRLALHPGMDLLEQVVGLLNDPDVEVRRASILAVGPADQVVHDEGLLPCLHDSDPQVRRLCEAALRGRGLGDVHLLLGRLLTDPNHRVRLQVLDHLGEAQDLDPGLWLRRLSHDPSISVRVAALRVMSEQTEVDLSDRVDQMARSDPSPSVRQLAQLYRTHLRKTPSHPGKEEG